MEQLTWTLPPNETEWVPIGPAAEPDGCGPSLEKLRNSNPGYRFCVSEGEPDVH